MWNSALLAGECPQARTHPEQQKRRSPTAFSIFIRMREYKLGRNKSLGGTGDDADMDYECILAGR